MSFSYLTQTLTIRSSNTICYSKTDSLKNQAEHLQYYSGIEKNYRNKHSNEFTTGIQKLFSWCQRDFAINAIVAIQTNYITQDDREITSTVDLDIDRWS